jgi:hypothetical protein
MNLASPIRYIRSAAALHRLTSFAPSRNRADLFFLSVQTFLPPELEGRKFLNDEDSLEGKKIDMEELSEWERKVNHGEPWEGRQALLRKLDGGHEGPS